MATTLSIQNPRAAVAPPQTKIHELDVPFEVYPVQVILYTAGPAQVIETTGEETPGGQVTIHLPNVPPPLVNTPIQIVLYDGETPTILEGVTTTPVNGVYGVHIPLGLTD